MRINSDDEDEALPDVGNAFAFSTVNRQGTRELWYCSDTLLGANHRPLPGSEYKVDKYGKSIPSISIDYLSPSFDTPKSI